MPPVHQMFHISALPRGNSRNHSDRIVCYRRDFSKPPFLIRTISARFRKLDLRNQTAKVRTRNVHGLRALFLSRNKTQTAAIQKVAQQSSPGTKTTHPESHIHRHTDSGHDTIPHQIQTPPHFFTNLILVFAMIKETLKQLFPLLSIHSYHSLCTCPQCRRRTKGKRMIHPLFEHRTD